MTVFNPHHINPMIRLERRFHPIGQGAFYTEVFRGTDGSRFVMVCDCGTETGAKDMEKDLDAQISELILSLGAKPFIDLLFISHFHDDHINGLDKLLGGVMVGTTIIPMLSLPVLTVTRVQNFLKYRSAALSSDKIIQELYLSGESSGRFGDVLVVEPSVESEDVGKDEKDKGIGNGKLVPMGEKLGNNPYWEYLPFNSIDICDKRAIDFMDGLVKLPGAMTGGQLNVKGLIRGCRKKVKDLYRSVMEGKDDNLYTLVVESRPAEGVVPSPNSRLSRCLYFGDFESKDNDALWNRLAGVYHYEDIGTIQIPHHGSRDNWRKEMINGGPRVYAVSSGSTNTYHHPDYWVLSDILEADHSVRVVSEKLKSAFIRVYEIL